MKKILVTGGTGFLGSRVFCRLSEKYEVYAPTRQEMDITDAQSVLQVMEKFRPDGVIHCGAVAEVWRCRQEPELSYAVNVQGTVHVVTAAKQIGAKTVICSSDQVYFSTPDNVYAREKQMAEQESLKIDPTCVCLRLTWMYDPRPAEISNHTDFYSTLLPKLYGNEPVSGAVYDMRGITDVNEVVENLSKAFQLPGGVYDFGSPNDQTMYETLREIFTRLGLDVQRVQEDRESFRDHPRDIRVKPDGLNGYGISFSHTVDGLVKNFQRSMHHGQTDCT